MNNKAQIEWRAVLGYEGVYEVSVMGDVRRVGCRNGRKALAQALGGSKSKNYKIVTLCVGGKQKTRRVHHLVLEAFVGLRPQGHVCRHLDGNPHNNRLDNLAWGSPVENEADKRRHGRRAIGSDVHSAKLTEAQVAKIKRSLKRRGDAVRLAKEYPVSYGVIRKIANGEYWGHVNG